ncbi:hypothetical protein Q8W14_02290 [Photobacterium damselae subsp. piscicida]|nr:hypothetical protein [Photobacterium damselae subsp. piscicida]
MAEHPILSEILTRLPQCTGLEEVQQTHQQVLAMAHQHKIHFPMNLSNLLRLTKRIVAII